MRTAFVVLLLVGCGSVALACVCVPPPPVPGQLKPSNSAICNHPPQLGNPSADTAIFHGKVREAYPRSIEHLAVLYRRITGRVIRQESHPPPIQGYKAFLLELLSQTITEAEAARIRDADSRETLEQPLLEMHWGVPRRVVLDVIEPFNGPPIKSFVLYTGFGGGDCGIDFEPGQEYLVFPYRAEQSGRWIAGQCGGTRHVRFAAEDVKTLAALKRGQTLPPRVYGWVTGHHLKKDGKGGSERGLAGAQLHLHGDGFERRTVSRGGGRFRFDFLPPGRYHVQVTLPGWRPLLRDSVEEEVELRPRGCAELRFVMKPTPTAKK